MLDFNVYSIVSAAMAVTEEDHLHSRRKFKRFRSDFGAGRATRSGRPCISLKSWPTVRPKHVMNRRRCEASRSTGFPAINNGVKNQAIPNHRTEASLSRKQDDGGGKAGGGDTCTWKCCLGRLGVHVRFNLQTRVNAVANRSLGLTSCCDATCLVVVANVFMQACIFCLLTDGLRTPSCPPICLTCGLIARM